MIAANMVITFVLELAMLVTYAFGGTQLASGNLWSWILLIACPLAVATAWGVFLSPKARVRLPYALTLFTRFALLAGGAAILWATHLYTFATIYSVALVVSLALTLVTRTIPGE